MSTKILGQVLLGQFRVDAFVASGGMGAVYRVWDLKRNVPLAMKVLHSELADDPVVFKRFQREANALKKLTHPNIVPFYGLYQTLDFAFLLERFIDGPSLGDILRQRQGKPLSVSDALVYLKALCAALGYAHANGVVHCDVKPGNVMVDQGGIYLTDFGIARHAESTTTTMAGAGTPAYMAPEQIRGEAVSPATDVYALGVMQFEMLTGQRPFRGNETGTEKGGATTNERIRYGHLNLAPPDPRSLNPKIPAALGDLILKALSKQPEARPVSTQDLFMGACAAGGISPAGVADRIAAQDLPVEHDITGGQELLPASYTPAAQSPRVARKWVWGIGTAGVLLIVCLFLVALAGGVYVLTRAKPSLVAPGAARQLPVETILPASTNDQSAIPLPPGDTPAPAKTSGILPSNTPLPAAIILPTDTASPTLAPTATPGPVIGSTWYRPADGMMMVYVPEENFSMGDTVEQAMTICRNYFSNCTSDWFSDEQPPHNVFLNAYWVDTTEVTNAMYNLCVQAGRCSSNGAVNDVLPAVNVNWFDASNYCAWAGGRLPTEAEWEKAARGTDGRIFPWGNSLPDNSLANFCANGDTCPAGKASPVGSYPAGVSPYGALDMAGNVSEWVNDWYEVYPGGDMSSFTNTSGFGQNDRLARGGSWYRNANFIRSINRFSKIPSSVSNEIGFRCARDIVP